MTAITFWVLDIEAAGRAYEPMRFATNALARTALSLISGEGKGHRQKVVARLTETTADPETTIDGWRLEDILASDEGEAETIAWRCVNALEQDAWATPD